MSQHQNELQRRNMAQLFDPATKVLVTGSNGFIGRRVVEALLARGFRNIRCLVRSKALGMAKLRLVIERFPDASVEIVEGNLKSRRDCETAVRNVGIILHLAAGSEKSFAGCFLNTVVTTRNLLDAVCGMEGFKRFVNVSSFAVYSNFELRRNAVLDEDCAVESEHVWRNEPYAYAKLRQEELVADYGRRFGVPYIIIRPGAVYGPGKSELTGRVGIGTFGIFLHLGGGNRIPFTHVDNCADAIVLAGFTPGVDGQVLNVVDDDLPTSRQFMAGYRKNVEPMRYLPVPYSAFYFFSWMWEKFSRWSDGQLPPVFNRRRCAAYWKGNRFPNTKAKQLLGWAPGISCAEGLPTYFSYLKQERH